MYINNVLNKLKSLLCSADSDKNEFYQAVEEVFSSLSDAITKEHQKNKILERLIIPEQVHKFKIIWERDNGDIEINTGYRVQYNSTLGIYKGGLRFHPSVNEKILKFLAFEQTFKNALTGLPMGGAKGGADINPKNMSESEMRRFCYAFADGLNKYIGNLTDVPAGDIGVGSREIGYIYAKLKKIRNKSEFGILTGKPIDIGGSLVRKEATGYGVVYFLINMLNRYDLIDSNYFPKRDIFYIDNLIKNQPLQGKKVVISGSGNVAIYAAEKIIQLGGKVLAMSDSSGTLIVDNGIDIEQIKELKEIKKERLSKYLENNNGLFINSSDYISGQHPIWNVENIDIALPCATQNELTLNDVRNLFKNNNKIVIVEGANMPTTSAALDFILDNKILFSPGKASNAGGVATSFLEMSQNASLISWNSQMVEIKIEEIMFHIFESAYSTAVKYNQERNLVLGANIYAFERVSKNMIIQGILN